MTIMHYTKNGEQIKKIDLKNRVKIIFDAYFNELNHLAENELPIDLFKSVTEEAEKTVILFVMNHYRNKQTKAAKALGINRTSLRKRLAEYKL